jgi:hypothetical protein
MTDTETFETVADAYAKKAIDEVNAGHLQTAQVLSNLAIASAIKAGSKVIGDAIEKAFTAKPTGIYHGGRSW